MGAGAYAGPQYEVTIPRPIAVSRFEITFSQWDICVAAGPCNKAADRGWGRQDRPVIFVRWEDAQDYLDWLSRITGRRYRLLSEAEWEYAARAVGNGSAASGEPGGSLGDVAWYKANTDTPRPVGGKAANAFKLHDMLGNVWEWVEDCWNESYATKPAELNSTGSAWVTGDCTRRVVPGGGWQSDVGNLRPADRNRVSDGLSILDLGFRAAREFHVR